MLFRSAENATQAREARADTKRMAYPLPERPSIAVLAFDNATGSAEHDVLAAGLTDTVNNTLSRLASMFVVARDAVGAYPAKTVPSKQLAEALGIRYVVRGTLERVGGQLSATARVTDALSGRQIWTKSYDVDHLGPLTVGQDMVIGTVESTGTRLTVRQREIVQRPETRNVEAWLAWRQATPMLNAPKALEEIFAARALLERALQLDPDFVAASVTLARSYSVQARSFLRGNARDLFLVAENFLERAVATDATRPESWAEMANYRIQRGDIDNSIEPAEKAANLDPNNWVNQATLATVLHRVGRHADAIRPLRLAMRLNPAIPAGTADMLGRAYMFDGQAAPAITAFENLLKRDLTPNEIFPIRSWLAVLYLERGDDTKAREQLKLALEAKPDLTATYFRRTYIYKDAAKTVLRWTGALRKLGLPEQ